MLLGILICLASIFLSFAQREDLLTRPPLCKDGKFYEDSESNYLNCSLCEEKFHHSNCKVCCSSKFLALIITTHLVSCAILRLFKQADGDLEISNRN